MELECLLMLEDELCHTVGQKRGKKPLMHGKFSDLCLLNTWHILGDSLIPLAPLSLVGFYM